MSDSHSKTKYQTWHFPMQFACFDCRKVYKQIVDAYKLDDEIRVCPQCSEKMFLMGRAFKAPNQNNIKQWKKVEHLIRNGFIFYSGARPSDFALTTLGNAKDFIENRRTKIIPKKRKKILFKKER